MNRLISGLVPAIVLCLASTALAAPKAAQGILVQIPSSITTESTKRLRSVLHGPLERFKASGKDARFIILCDFNPEGRKNDCADFGACLDLARYLRSLSRDTRGIHTVAYVHNEVRQHSVLPVLACSEIVLSEKPGGKFGKIAPRDEPLERYERTAYEDLARDRYPAVLIRKMFESGVRVVKAGDQYADGAKQRGQPVAGFPENDTVLYDYALAKKVGLCQAQPSNSLEELRTAYNLPRSGPARAVERTVCWRIPIEGELTGEAVELTRRRIRRALRARVNILVLELKCAGGDADKAYELGLYLAGLNDDRPDNPVDTIAFVTTKARNLAVFPALACNRIVMQREEGGNADDDDVLSLESRLGGFDLYIRRHPSLEELRAELEGTVDKDRRRELTAQLAQARGSLEQSLRANLAEIAAKQMYPEVLAAGFFSPGLRIHAVERSTGISGRMLLSEDDLKADQAGPRRWRSVFLVKPWKGEARSEQRYLTLTATQAKELGIASVVKDWNDLCENEGINPARVHTPEADWLDGLADFLRDPWTSVFLVMLGVACLILELKMPGVGLPGVISAICFVLFFWAHSQLNGQITWLAILLFVLGLILIGIEVFVLPGFGVCGISGILLVLTSLGLVAYGHWPRTGSEWVAFGHKLSPFGFSMLGSLAVVVLVVRYLPHIPVLNRLMLRNAENEGGETLADQPLHQELQALLGAIGVAATPLRPAGKTQFGDSFVDVVAEGGYIMPGTRVQVIEVEGNRVVVKEV